MVFDLIRRDLVCELADSDLITILSMTQAS